METSTIKSVSKPPFSRHELTFFEPEVPEESTWSMYIQDFCNNYQESQDRFCYDNNSLVSDAASFVSASKIVRKAGNVLTTSGSKKRRTINGNPNFVGNDLEDTASSPSTSPKVCSMEDEQNDNPTTEETRGMNQEKESGLRHINQIIEMGLEGEDGELTELKKKGLCLVPLSMLTNYIA